MPGSGEIAHPLIVKLVCANDVRTPYAGARAQRSAPGTHVYAGTAVGCRGGFHGYARVNAGATRLVTDEVTVPCTRARAVPSEQGGAGKNG